MPAKAKVTKEMRVEAAFAVARETGAETSIYLMNLKKASNGVILGIGMNYIRFAIKEPHLFRFLFQSDYFNGSTLLEMIDAKEHEPVLFAMREAVGLDTKRTKKVFLTVFLFAHGYASIIANNALKYDEGVIKSHLEQACKGAILAPQNE